MSDEQAATLILRIFAYLGLNPGQVQAETWKAEILDFDAVRAWAVILPILRGTSRQTRLQGLLPEIRKALVEDETRRREGRLRLPDYNWQGREEGLKAFREIRKKLGAVVDRIG